MNIASVHCTITVARVFFSLNVYFMYNINIFEHIQDMCLLHYNIIQWDSEESQLTYEVCYPFMGGKSVF